MSEPISKIEEALLIFAGSAGRRVRITNPNSKVQVVFFPKFRTFLPRPQVEEQMPQELHLLHDFSGYSEPDVSHSNSTGAVPSTDERRCTAAFFGCSAETPILQALVLHPGNAAISTGGEKNSMRKLCAKRFNLLFKK